jgi:hypothetical protein
MAVKDKERATDIARQAALVAIAAVEG